MTVHKAPHVYIAGRRMDDFAASNHPVLGGLSLDFGVESDLDFPDGDSCRFSLAVREAEHLDFLQLGAEVAVYHEQDLTDPEDDRGYTYFVGRIQRLSAGPHPELAGTMLYSVECSDLTSDLAALEVFNVNSAATPGATRLGNLDWWLPEPWKLGGWVRWPDLQHAALHFERVPALDLIDAFARAQILRRRNASTFTPESGIDRVLNLMEDSTKDTRADQLVHFSGSTRWGVTPGKPYGPDVTISEISGRDLHRDAGWVKEPEDVITEVVLSLVDNSVYNADEQRWEDSATYDVAASDLATGATELQAKYGHRQASFRTDLGRTATSTHLVPIMKHWLNGDSAWRPTDLSFRTTENLSVKALRQLLGVHNRFSAFVIIRGLMPNRPDAAHQFIRGFVIGGSATWTGTEWELSLKLGREPAVGAGLGDWWTLERLAASAQFRDATLNSVGDALTLKDFIRIGEPS